MKDCSISQDWIIKEDDWWIGDDWGIKEVEDI